jgi:hypothetical protein
VKIPNESALVAILFVAGLVGGSAAWWAGPLADRLSVSAGPATLDLPPSGATTPAEPSLPETTLPPGADPFESACGHLTSIRQELRHIGSYRGKAAPIIAELVRFRSDLKADAARIRGEGQPFVADALEAAARSMEDLRTAVSEGGSTKPQVDAAILKVEYALALLRPTCADSS